jgi:hypothetical protein
MAVPPHEVVYHFQLALLPRLPPLMRNLLLLPGQTESALAITLLTAVDWVLTWMDLLAHAEVLQVPSALTK